MNLKKDNSILKEPVVRYKKNPIITSDDVPVSVNSVLNPGAIRFNEEYILLLRVEYHDRISRFHVARSQDGICFDISKDSVNLPTVSDGRYQTNVYDARVTFLDSWYYVTACCEWSGGCRIGTWRTKDFVDFKWVCFASQTEQRNATLFPAKINGLYARLDRPLNQYDQGNMWISYSPDMVFWGKSDIVLETRFHNWDEHKLGPACVPIECEKGWLVIYHGVRNNASTCIYKLGVCLLDKNDPSKVLARSNNSILGPKENYERVGDVPNVVFSNGAIVEDDGSVKIYYGACDQVVCLAYTTVEDLIYFAENH